MVRAGTGTPASGDTTGLGVPFATNTTYDLLAKYSWDAGASQYKTITMWLNPTSTDNVSSPNGDVQLTLTGAGLASVSQLLFRQAVLSDADDFTFDNVKIGSAWADVIPEPSSAAMFGIGAFALLGIRRRAKR